MSTERTERSNRPASKKPTIMPEIYRRGRLFLAGLALLGLSERVVRSEIETWVNPPVAEAQEVVLGEPLTPFSSLSITPEQARVEAIKAKSGAISVTSGECQSYWVLTHSKAYGSTYDGVLYRSVCDTSGMLKPLAPLPKSRLVGALGLEVFGPNTALIWGTDGNGAAVEITNDGKTTSIVKLPGSNSTDVFFNTAKINSNTFLAGLDSKSTNPTKVWVMDAGLDANSKLNPVFKATDIKIVQDSMIASKKVDTANPKVKRIYSIQATPDATGKKGLMSRDIDVSTGKVLSESVVDNRFGSSPSLPIQEVTGSYIDSSGTETVLLFQSNALYLLDPNKPKEAQIYPSINILSKISAPEDPPTIKAAGYDLLGNVILTGSFRDKSDTKVKLFVVKLLAGKNPSTDPNAVEIIYVEKDPLAVNPFHMRIDKIDDEEVALISTGIGELVVSLKNKVSAFANKGLTTPPPSAINNDSFIPATFRGFRQ